MFRFRMKRANQDTHNAVVLQRGRWHDQPTFLVGFSQATLAASFSPIIYKPTAEAAAAGSRPAHHVVAVAGQDNVITVWLAAAARPVVILKEVFQQPPSDLSWGADGYTLVVSGYDGTVVVLRFTPEELGAVLPEVSERACSAPDSCGGFDCACLGVCWLRLQLKDKYPARVTVCLFPVQTCMAFS